ncbi:YjbF family lipoprotein [Thioclava atlantica]|uniref:Lipoprotein n=1 Tax=Thioclava atlantica TaxID=1317124 RepID=A0A085TSZ0_9RHOB|nr:YjbF family lipoprotein [Thioclava atlantica]KFE33837.1 lipoprotein [Thioclava atlantica]
MIPAKGALISATLALALLSGCTSHDSAGVQESKSAGGTMVKAALGSVFSGSKKETAQASAPTDPSALATSALQSIKGPVILVTFEASKASTIGAMRGENSAMRTYQTPDQRAFVLRDGLLAGTRGFGRDLMSADTSAAARLIHARMQGTAQRVYRYLDGDGQERPLPVSCTIQPAGTVQQSGISVRQVAEHCEGSGVTLDMSYLVAPDGTILASRQWIGPALGYVAIQQLRN